MFGLDHHFFLNTFKKKWFVDNDYTKTVCMILGATVRYARVVQMIVCAHVFVLTVQSPCSL